MLLTGIERRLANLRPARKGDPPRNPYGTNAFVRRRDMLRQIAREFGELTPEESVHIDQIAELLTVAAKTSNDVVRVRCHNSVARLLARIRKGRAQSRRNSGITLRAWRCERTTAAASER
jgi:hypothetical protein